MFVVPILFLLLEAKHLVEAATHLLPVGMLEARIHTLTNNTQTPILSPQRLSLAASTLKAVKVGRTSSQENTPTILG